MYYRIRKEIINTFFGSLGKLVEECVIDVDEDGISTIAMDTAGVALIYCHIGPLGYDLVEEMGDEKKIPEGKYGIDIPKFLTAINLLNADVEISFFPDYITLTSVNNSFNVRTLDIRTIKTPPAMPSKGAEVKATIPGKELSEAIKSSSAIASMTRIEVDPGLSMIKFRSRSESRGDTLNYSKDLPDMVIEGTPSVSLYTNEYLKDIIKYFSGLDELVIHIGNDKPLRIEALWPDTDLSMVYFLAPRLEHDD